MDLGDLQARLASYIKRRDELKAKIRRLKAAKTVIQTSKNNLSAAATRLNGKVNSQDFYGYWSGDTQKDAQNFAGGVVVTEYNYYVRMVDCRLDDICDEITRLENELSSVLGIIGQIQAAINNLLNEIEKATN